MTEKSFTLNHLNPAEFFGVNNTHFDQLRSRFPRLKIIGRDNEIKAIGHPDDIALFGSFLHQLLEYYEVHGRFAADAFRTPDIPVNEMISPSEVNGTDVIVPGRNGSLIRARTPNQRKLAESISTNDLVFAIGPAGTGKTYTSVALAVRALKNREVKRIILTRPAVEAGENLGFLPGDLKDKLDPYLQPLYDALFDMIPAQKLTSYLEEGVIEIAPLAFMRGRTLDHAFVILDEAQNATIPQMKMFLTRMGRAAHFIVTGDVTQVDLPRSQASGLIHADKILQGIEGIAFIYLNKNDIIRHRLVTEIINAYNDENKD